MTGVVRVDGLPLPPRTEAADLQGANVSDIRSETAVFAPLTVRFGSGAVITDPSCSGLTEGTWSFGPPGVCFDA